MKAIWNNRLYSVLEVEGDNVILITRDSGIISVPLYKRSLIINPTDAEVEAVACKTGD